MAERRKTDLNIEQRLTLTLGSNGADPFRSSAVASNKVTYRDWPWVCNALTSRKGTSAKVRMLDTIILSQGEPIAWYYTNKQGIVAKRSKSQCSRDSILKQFIQAANASNSNTESEAAAVSFSDARLVSVVGAAALQQILFPSDAVKSTDPRPSSAGSDALVSSRSLLSTPQTSSTVVLGADVRAIQSIHTFVSSKKRGNAPDTVMVNYTVEYSFPAGADRPVCTCLVVTQASTSDQAAAVASKSTRSIRPTTPLTMDIATTTTRSLATHTNKLLKEATLAVAKAIETNQSVFVVNMRCEFRVDSHGRVWFVRAVQSQTTPLQTATGKLLVSQQPQVWDANSAALADVNEASSLQFDQVRMPITIMRSPLSRNTTTSKAQILHARSIPPQERLATLHKQQLAHQEHIVTQEAHRKAAAHNVVNNASNTDETEPPNVNEPRLKISNTGSSSPFLVNSNLSVTGFVDKVLDTVDERSKTLDDAPGMDLGSITAQLKASKHHTKRFHQREKPKQTAKRFKSNTSSSKSQLQPKSMIVQQEEKVRNALLQVQHMEQLGRANAMAAKLQTGPLSEQLKMAQNSVTNLDTIQPDHHASTSNSKTFFAATKVKQCSGDYCHIAIESMWEQGEALEASQPNAADASAPYARPKSAGSASANHTRNDIVEPSISKGDTGSGTLRPKGDDVQSSLVKEHDHEFTKFILYKDVAQARNEKELVDKLLKRLARGQKGDYYSTSLAGGIRDSRASEAYSQLIGRTFPSQHYKEVGVCRRCLSVYNKIEEARSASIHRIQTWESKTKRIKLDGENVSKKPVSSPTTMLVEKLNDPETCLSPRDKLEQGAARIATSLLSKKDVAEFRSLTKPPPGVLLVSKALFVLLTGKQIPWEKARTIMANGERFLALLLDFDVDAISAKRFAKLESFVSNPAFRPTELRPVSNAAATFCSWLLGVLKEFCLVLGKVYPPGLKELDRIDLVREMEQLGHFSSYDQSMLLNSLKSADNDSSQQQDTQQSVTSALTTTLPRIGDNTTQHRPNSRDSNSRGSNRPNSSGNSVLVPAPSYLSGSKRPRAVDSTYSLSLTEKLAQQRHRRNRKRGHLSPINSDNEITGERFTSRIPTSISPAVTGKVINNKLETQVENSVLKEFTKDINQVDQDLAAGYYSRGPRGLSIAQERAMTPTQVSFSRHDSTATSSNNFAKLENGTKRKLGAKKLTPSEKRAADARRKVQSFQMSRLHSNTAHGGDNSATPNRCVEFTCGNGDANILYQVNGSGSLDPTIPNLVVINDFFDTLEAVQIFLEPLISQRPGCQALVFNTPGQAFTKFSQQSGRVPPLNNEFSAKCLHELLQHLEDTGEFVTSYKPFFVIGFGNGANTGLCFSGDFGNLECYRQSFKGLVSVNGFAQVDKQLAAVLHSSSSVFGCFPPTRSDLPISYFTRFLFSDSYVKKIDPDLVLNLYTAVMNPISLQGRIAICNGALKHKNLSKLPKKLKVPIILVQSTDDVLVNPTNVDPFLNGRSATHLWSHQLQQSNDGRVLNGLGSKGDTMMKQCMNNDDSTFVIWVKSGHEVRQECKKQVLNIFSSLVDSLKASESEPSTCDDTSSSDEKTQSVSLESKEPVAVESGTLRYTPKLIVNSGSREGDASNDNNNSNKSAKKPEDDFEQALRRHKLAKQKAREERELRLKEKSMRDERNAPAPANKDPGTSRNKIQKKDDEPVVDESISKTFTKEEKDMLKGLGMDPDSAPQRVTDNASVPDDETILQRKIEALRREQEERRKAWEAQDNERIARLQQQLEEQKQKRQDDADRRWNDVEEAMVVADGEVIEVQGTSDELQNSLQHDQTVEAGIEGSFTVLPDSSQFSQRPGSSQASQRPGSSQSSQQPSSPQSSQRPGSSQSSQRPDSSQSSQRPGSSQSSQRPGSSQSSQGSFQATQLPVTTQPPIQDESDATPEQPNESVVNSNTTAPLEDHLNFAGNDEEPKSKEKKKSKTKVIVPNPTELLNVFEQLEDEDEKQKQLGILEREEFEKVKLEMQHAENKRLEKIEALKTDELKLVREAAAIALQRVYRGYQDRSKFVEVKYAAHVSKIRNEAAVRIQAIHRGRAERRRVAILRDLHAREQLEGEATRIIQRVSRGRQGRNIARKRRVKQSTLTAQRVYRGYLGRVVARAELSKLEARRTELRAATKIQSVWRMRVDREHYLTVQLRDLAAAQIQRVYRGVRGRRAAARKKEWEVAKPGPERIELGIKLIEESKLAFESQQEEIDALHRAQERAETQVNKIHAGLRESEKELAVLEQELQDVDHLDRTLHEMTHQKEVLESSMTNNASSKTMLDQSEREFSSLQKSKSKANSFKSVAEGGGGASSEQIRDRDKARASQAYQLEMAMHIKRAERDRKKKALEAEFAGVHMEVEMKKTELARLEENIQTMEATRKRKEREFQRLQRNLMELLEEQKQELDNIREKGIELETATATSAAAAAATAHKAKENEKRSKEMFNSTEELMKFQFMSMSLSYFSSMNMLKNLRDMNQDTSIAAISSSAETAAAAAAATAAANIPDLAHLRLSGSSGLVDAAAKRRREEEIDHKRRIEEAHAALAKPFPEDVSTWTVDDVCRWLDTLSLSQYKAAFAEASVDGAFLLDLRPEDMRDILGMSHTLHVQKVVVMLNKIRPLSDQELTKQKAVLWEKRGEAARQGLEQQEQQARIPDIDVVFSQIRNGRYRKVEDSLNAGFDVDTCDIYGNTALIIACQNLNKRIAELLLNRGANINHQNNQGNTPMHYGMAYDPEGAIGEFLIGRGADDTLENKIGLSPYDGIE